MDLEVDYRLVQGMNTPIFGIFSSGSTNRSCRRNREGVEAPRNSLDCPVPSSRWIPFGFEIPAAKHSVLSTCAKAKPPGVVARLMGLETMPGEDDRSCLAQTLETQSQEAGQFSRATKSVLGETFREGTTPNYSPRVTHRSRQLLEAMRSLEPSKDSFLQFESPVEPVNEEPLKTPTLLHLLLNGHEGQRAETRKKVSIDNGSTRIVVLKPGPAKGRQETGSCSPPVHASTRETRQFHEKVMINKPHSPDFRETTSNKVFETQPRFHREEFEPDSPAREKQQSAREFVIHRLRDGSKDAKEIAQEITRKARESAFRDVSSHLPSPERTPLDIQDASTPTLRRYISCYQSLESANLTTSSPAYQTTPIKLSRKQALVDEDRPGDTLEQRTFSEDYDTRLAPQVEIVEATGNASETLDKSSIYFGTSQKTLGRNSSIFKSTESGNLVYVSKVLLASKNLPLYECDSRRPVAISQAFQTLEADYQGNPDSLSHRRFLFDVVNEILARKSCKPSSRGLLRDVWSEICHNTGLQQQSVEGLHQGDVSKEANWAGTEEELQRIAVQIAKEIFSFLLDEAARELLKSGTCDKCPLVFPETEE
ncbi:hypothetical protein SELMODRAFT_419371 [Selaginella moellendorffii]|uniref:DUF4378 domain-containing protein n=1 Tax=Selaginella moellendorffii TaxID=88036 RepID=D8S8Q5_SELML|nr:hypothetical protein SELMODRAFT_419371 [Selaginella moellendorffii]